MPVLWFGLGVKSDTGAVPSSSNIEAENSQSGWYIRLGREEKLLPKKLSAGFGRQTWPTQETHLLLLYKGHSTELMQTTTNNKS